MWSNVFSYLPGADGYSGQFKRIFNQISNGDYPQCAVSMSVGPTNYGNTLEKITDVVEGYDIKINNLTLETFSASTRSVGFRSLDNYIANHSDVTTSMIMGDTCGCSSDINLNNYQNILENNVPIIVVYGSSRNNPISMVGNRNFNNVYYLQTDRASHVTVVLIY